MVEPLRRQASTLLPLDVLALSEPLTQAVGDRRAPQRHG